MDSKDILNNFKDGLYSIHKKSDDLKVDQKICRVSTNEETKEKEIAIFDQETKSFIKLEKFGEDSVLEKITFDDIS